MNTSCSFTINLQNSSILSQHVLYQPYELVLYQIVMPCIIVVGLTGNVSFIWTVIRVSSLHTSTFIYLFSLAWSDLFTLVGFGIYITNGFLSPLRFGKGTLVEGIAETMWWFSFITSIWFVTFVTLERYLAICHPIKHRLLKGTNRTIQFCLLSVVLSLVLTCTIVVQGIGKTSIWCLVWPSDDQFLNYPITITVFSGILDHRYLDFNIFLAISYIIIDMLILFMNCYMYASILITLHRRKYNKALQMSVELDKNIRQISTMVTANGIVFFLCSAVFNALMAYSVINMFGVRLLTQLQVDAFEHVRYIFILINASVNPLIYFITNPNYRRALKASVMKWRRDYVRRSNGMKSNLTNQAPRGHHGNRMK